MTPGAELALALIDPRRNARRFYRLTVVRDPQLPLFAGEPALVLVVARGRIGRAPVVRRLAFASAEALERAWTRLEKTRLAHGYVVTAWTPGSTR